MYWGKNVSQYGSESWSAWKSNQRVANVYSAQQSNELEWSLSVNGKVGLSPTVALAVSDVEREILAAEAHTARTKWCYENLDEAAERIDRLERALSGIVNHWYEFAEMRVENKTDYGMSERINAAHKLLNT